ncbi:MAG: FAD-dependent oxidoreductase [Lachnospiraceae bacterium]|nr:FAD-dependent oxidoreductase [Lachnospiraceae bacterium]
MIRLNQIKVPIIHNEETIRTKIEKIIKTKDFTIKNIVKKSIDARDKNELMYIYSLDIKANNENIILKRLGNNNNIMSTKELIYELPYECTDPNITSPIIIGAGPAGYFCGLYLAKMGFRPIIFERGMKVEERSEAVEGFWNGTQSINPNCNVSFGEGGAGTFSDGKLNTGIKDKYGRINAVINDFISFGAPEDIGYLNKPHIGTDELKKVLVNMRNEIIKLGGQIHFNSCFIDYKIKKNTPKNSYVVTIKDLITGNNKEYTTNSLIIAIGHSARDTFKMLFDNKLPMEPKAFAIGVRVEHPRTMIDQGQYGNSEAAKQLPAADYKMTFRSSEGRSVYSFCMCPGGFVVNASSDNNQAVVNGMSNHGRDEVNSNSAIVVNVTPEDFEAEGFGCYGVLAGVEFQKKYEALAYNEGKGCIPVQTFKDYKANIASMALGEIKPNIRGKYTLGNLNNCLPVYVNNAIIEGISYYDTRLSGFAREDSVLSGIESRTSSPVRIVRDDTFMSAVRGIFPCGEGAGYAGGITSAAVDGIKVAEACAAYLLDE